MRDYGRRLRLLLPAILLAGCNWTVPHDNPVDPEGYGYQPIGNLAVTVLSALDNSPVVRAEVRLPNLGVFALVDTNGNAFIGELKVGEHWLMAERRGDGLQAFRLDSLKVSIFKGVTTSDTIYLTPLPPAPGALSLQVLNLSQQPIDSATVVLPALGRFALTDQQGFARFEDVPVGGYWVEAFRTEEPVFARDSIQVNINPGALTYASIRLDALPYFLAVSVNCFTTALRADSIVFRLKLKARVDDPDGPQDIQWVEWRFRDILSGALAYNAHPDSGFWETDLPSDSLPEGNIDAALNVPFDFIVFDASRKSVQTTATLTKILRRPPTLNRPEVVWVPQPNLRWVYEFNFEFGDIRQFYYLLRVYRDDPEPRVVYDTLLISNGTSSQEHQLVRPLSQNNYYWYVWVMDKIGNYSRSQRGHIIPQQ